MDTLAPRQRLKDSYDQIFAKDIPGVVDAVESKVFGIGAESYTVGSHEFYMCYAMSRPERPGHLRHRPFPPHRGGQRQAVLHADLQG